jgi:hypothetical protein
MYSIVIVGGFFFILNHLKNHVRSVLVILIAHWVCSVLVVLTLF